MKLSQQQEDEEGKKNAKGWPERKPKAKEIKPKKTKEMPMVKEVQAIAVSGTETSSDRSYMYDSTRKSGHSTGRSNVHSARSRTYSSTQTRASHAKKDDLPSYASPSFFDRADPRLAHVKEKKSRHILEEVSDSIPSAASLVADAFDDFEDASHENSDSSRSLLPSELRELMETSSVGTDLGSFSTDASGITMDNLSTSTWFRSFQSFEKSKRTIPTYNSNRTMMSMSAASSSLQGIMEEQSMDDMDESSINALDLAFPVHQEFENQSANVQKLKAAGNQISSFSLLSDLTGDSSHYRRHLQSARHDCGFTLTSELTDMSDSLKGMDLASL